MREEPLLLYTFYGKCIPFRKSPDPKYRGTKYAGWICPHCCEVLPESIIKMAMVIRRDARRKRA